MSRKTFLTIAIAVLMITAPAMAGEIVNVNLNISTGSVDITATGFDGSTWHPGSIGEQNSIQAVGGA